MRFNYDLYASWSLVGELIKLGTPHIYTFENLGDFRDKQGELKPTPKPLFPFGERNKMQGLAYIVFPNRVGFTYEEDLCTAHISDFRGDANIALTTIVSETNHLMGLTPDKIAFLKGKKQVPFVNLCCIYKPNFSGLVIASYEILDPVKTAGIAPTNFDLPDQIAF